MERRCSSSICFIRQGGTRVCPTSVIPAFLRAENLWEVPEGKLIEDYEDDIEFIDKLKIDGYDGIAQERQAWRRLENGKREQYKAKQYYVFSPTQIKSATGNQGTFDPDNPDIRYSPSRQDDTPDDLFTALLKQLEEQGVIKQPEREARPEDGGAATGTKYARTEGQRTSVGDTAREWFGPRDVEER